MKFRYLNLKLFNYMENTLIWDHLLSATVWCFWKLYKASRCQILQTSEWLSAFLVCVHAYVCVWFLSGILTEMRLSSLWRAVGLLRGDSYWCFCQRTGRAAERVLERQTAPCVILCPHRSAAFCCELVCSRCNCMMPNFSTSRIMMQNKPLFLINDTVWTAAENVLRQKVFGANLERTFWKSDYWVYILALGLWSWIILPQFSHKWNGHNSFYHVSFLWRLELIYANE